MSLCHISKQLFTMGYCTSVQPGQRTRLWGIGVLIRRNTHDIVATKHN